MLSQANNQTTSHKVLVKRINFQLTNNFFSLEELETLSLRAVKKIVKSIARLENTKLSRSEIKEIALYLKSNLSNPVNAVKKLWAFAVDYTKEVKVIVKKIFSIFLLLIPKSYQEDKFNILRI